MGLEYPLINGLAYDFSSVEITAPGGIYTDITEISYSHTLEPGELRGTSSGVLARTRGVYSAEGSLTMYLPSWQKLRSILGSAYMETAFLISASYAAFGNPLIADQLIGCRVSASEASFTQGADPLVKTIPLSIIEILEDNQPATADGILSF